MGELSDGTEYLLLLPWVAFTIFAKPISLTLHMETSLYFVLMASGISGIGTSIFFPAKEIAVMAKAPATAFGGY
jgi:hypothetical protein